MLIPPVMTVAQTGANQDNDTHPLVAWSDDDGQQVTAVFRREPWTGSAASPSVMQATIPPWGTWPATPNAVVSASALLPGEPIDGIVVDRGANSGLSLLISNAKTLLFTPQVDPLQSNPGPLTAVNGEDPAFVSRTTGDRYLVGATANLASKLVVTELAIEGAAASVVTETVLGCGAPGHLPADAVAFDDGWIVAFSNDSDELPGGGCTTPGPVGGGPRLDVVRVHPGGAVEFITALSSGVPIQDVRLAPHPNGAWFVFQTPTTGGQAGKLRAGRVMLPGFGIVGPQDVSQGADLPLVFDAASIGEQLVIAWTNQLAGGEKALMVSLVDEGAVPKATTSFESSIHGYLSLVGSPKDNSVLIAWGSWLGHRIELGRFDCTP